MRLIKEHIIERVLPLNGVTSINFTKIEPNLKILCIMHILGTEANYHKSNLLLNSGIFWQEHKASLLRINYNHMNLRFKHYKYIQMIIKQHDKKVGLIIQTTLQTSRNWLLDDKKIRSIPFYYKDISKIIKRLSGDNFRHKMMGIEIEEKLNHIISSE